MLVHVWGVAYAAGTLCICVCNSLPDVSWQNQLFSACCMKELQKLEPERSSSYSLPQWAVTGHMGMTHTGGGLLNVFTGSSEPLGFNCM